MPQLQEFIASIGKSGEFEFFIWAYSIIKNYTSENVYCMDMVEDLMMNMHSCKVQGW